MDEKFESKLDLRKSELCNEKTWIFFNSTKTKMYGYQFSEGYRLYGYKNH